MDYNRDILELFNSATRYLDVVQEYYPNGITNRPNISKKNDQVKNHAEIKNVELIDGIVFGERTSRFIFLISSQHHSIESFKDDPDGVVLFSLINNALKLNVEDYCICLFSEVSAKSLADFLSKFNLTKDQRIICFGEEFCLFDDFDKAIFKYIGDQELVETERGIGKLQESLCLFTYALQELRMSSSYKKYFWQKILESRFTS